MHVGTRGVWADIKRIHQGTNPGRVRNVIKKANAQIKRAVGDTEVGFCVVCIEHDQFRASLDDRVPSDVAVYVDEVDREMGSTVSRSVGQVVVYWDPVCAVRARTAHFAFRQAPLARNSP